MEKSGNWFAVAKMCEMHLKEKEILSKITAYLLKMSLSTEVFSLCCYKSTTRFLLMQIISSKWVNVIVINPHEL